MNKDRVRSMLVMPSAEDVARDLAREIDPKEANYWSERKLSAAARYIFNARQEGYDAAIADAATRVNRLARSWEQIADVVHARGKEGTTTEKEAMLRRAARELRELLQDAL